MSTNWNSFTNRIHILETVSNTKQKSRSKEKLSLCQEFRADQSERIAAQKRKDFEMLALLSDEFITKEGKYHNI